MLCVYSPYLNGLEMFSFCSETHVTSTKQTVHCTLQFYNLSKPTGSEQQHMSDKTVSLHQCFRFVLVLLFLCLVCSHVSYMFYSTSTITSPQKLQFLAPACDISQKSLMCIWTFSIVTEYTNMTFQKQTAFIFRWSTILRISNNLKEPKTYKFICKRQNNPNIKI